MSTLTTPIVYAGDESQPTFYRDTVFHFITALDAAIPVLVVHNDSTLAEARDMVEKLRTNLPADDRIEGNMRMERYHLSSELTAEAVAVMIRVDRAIESGDADYPTFRLDMQHSTVKDWYEFAGIYATAEDAQATAKTLPRGGAFPEPRIVEADAAVHALELTVRALRAAGYRLDDDSHLRQWIAMDIFLVVYNITSDVKIPRKWKQYIKAIEEVYYFDRAMHVHQCSITPDHQLYHVETREVLKDGLEEEIGEDKYESLRDEINSWVLMNLFSEDQTRSVSDIDRLLAANPDGRIHHYGNPSSDWEKVDGDDDEEKYKNIIEGVGEDFRGNSYI